MKLMLNCLKCPHDNWKPLYVEVEDNGVYLFTCDDGHKTLQSLSNSKFELLFDMALLALLDGYTREAVTTLAASIEEFYRFYIKIILVKKGQPPDDIRKLMKRINRAEQELGAFATLYFLEKATIPSFPDQWSTEFRNNVTHKGTIPKFDEVVKYGDRIVRFLIPLWKEYRVGFEHMIVVGSDFVSNLTDEQKAMPNKGSSHYPTSIVYLSGSEDDLTFEDALKRLKESSFQYLTNAK